MYTVVYRTLLTDDWRVAWLSVVAAAAAGDTERRQWAACKREDLLASSAQHLNTDVFSHRTGEPQRAASSTDWCARPTTTPGRHSNTQSHQTAYSPSHTKYLHRGPLKGANLFFYVVLNSSSALCALGWVGRKSERLDVFKTSTRLTSECSRRCCWRDLCAVHATHSW